MTRVKDPSAYLADILREIECIDAFIADEPESRKTLYAVMYALAVIGEIVRRLPEDFTAAHPAIPWRKIIGLRNMLVHEYEEVNHLRVTLVAKQDIKELRHYISQFLEK